MERTSECQLPERKKDDDECGDYRPADGRSRQQHPEVDSTRRRRPDFRHSRLDNRPYLQGGTALSRIASSPPTGRCSCPPPTSWRARRASRKPISWITAASMAWGLISGKITRPATSSDLPR